MALSGDEARRYSRQLVLKSFGGVAQQKLESASVLVIGAGGLGSPAIAYLAGAGVGTLGIADPDIVSVSNLHRQVIHGTADDGRLKVESAAAFVSSLNPHVTVIPHPVRLDPANALDIMASYDLVLDGTDTLLARRAVAAAAAQLAKPLVSGAVSMTDGQLTVFAPGGPQFAELYPAGADDADFAPCEVVGVLGPATGVIGTLMAMEAIKLVTGVGTPLIGRLLVYEGLAARFTELAFGA